MLESPRRHNNFSFKQKYLALREKTTYDKIMVLELSQFIVFTRLSRLNSR